MKDSGSPTPRSCPRCEQPLPPDAPEGLCPECLMLGGLETMPMPGGYRPSGQLPEPGETFGNYRIGAELGRGGMGAVFEAEQLDTGRRVALKLLNHRLDSPEARARFLREGRLAASINHANSVYVFGTEEIGEMPAISMELVGGGTLEEQVKREGPMAIGEAVDAALQLVAGLEAAQEIGILHRDVKPGNCFRDIDGSVKIGDFGLSISTEAREENHLTVDGAIFGTPAFASPEQLRGDELNLRSDLYSVGATLFFLLTGRTPFGGGNLAQLFANVLEKKAPSPREFRSEIPSGLAAVILRCLEKEPGDRFHDYADLRRALTPFSSEAAVPASIGLRLVAALVDWAIYLGVFFGIQFLVSGDLFVMSQPSRTRFVLSLLAGLGYWIAYFGIMEGTMGFSVGKGLCRLRVTDEEGRIPGFSKAAVRALSIMAIPSLPVWIWTVLDPERIMGTTGEGQWNTLAVSSSFYLILGLLFVTARRRNGWASLVDRWTRTRIVRRKEVIHRPGSREEVVPPVVLEDATLDIGPYRLLESAGDGEESEWVTAYDGRLLRKVWIHRLPAGTPPVPRKLRQLGRPGRLRWLAGRRSETENWDAYEFPGGKALASLGRGAGEVAPSWERVRFWLLDLAEEFMAAEREGDGPVMLSLDRIWITEKGRAKLLDFRAPGLERSADEEPESPVSSPGELMGQVAALARSPLPLHARNFQSELKGKRSPAEVAANLRGLLGRPVEVTRRRRAAMIAASLALPLVASLLMIAGSGLMKRWQREQPELLELNQVLSFRDAMNMPWMRGNDAPDDELFALYVGAHYREVIEDPGRWNSTLAKSILSPPKRRFAEQSLAEFPESPDPVRLAEAEKQIGPSALKPKDNPFTERWFPFVVFASSLLIYVSLPALAASLICRGGFVMRACGVAVVHREDGEPASRLRCFWRSLVAWSPLWSIPFLLAFLVPSVGMLTAAGIATGFLVLTTAINLAQRERSLPDRIAGTLLVPR